MKRNYLCGCVIVVAALALTGCGAKSGESAAVEEIGPKYSQKGLLLPDESLRSLGVKIVDVTEQKVSATLDLQLRVYQNGKEFMLGSAMVTPEEAKRLKNGLTVHVRSGSENLSGRVTRVNDELQKATGMAEVLVKFENKTGAPGAGSFLSATVDLESEDSVVAIPRAALLTSSEGPSVYTVSGEHFMRTPITVGATNGDLIEITDGLYAGDQVVLQPVMSLWMTELAAVKGGQACCAVPAKGK